MIGLRTVAEDQPCGILYHPLEDHVRKLKFVCLESQAHHALAVCAITEIGLTKGYAKSEGFTRHISQSGDGWRLDEGRYETKPPDDQVVVITTTTDAGCDVRWQFSWPGLRLIGYTSLHCHCEHVDTQIHG